MAVKGPLPAVSTRIRNPQGQGGKLRADLIAAADRILARTGDVPSLSLRAVAREVGIATPSIYLHFSDKAALVDAVLAVRFAQLAEAVRSAVEQAGDPAEQLRAGCRAYCQFATEHPNAYRVLFAVTRSPGQPGAADTPAPPAGPVSSLPADDPGAQAFGLLVQGVERCMAAGVSPAGDPFRVATSVWTALHGIVSLRSSDTGFPWPPLEQQLDDVLAGLVGLNGLRHNRAPAEE